MTLHLSFPFPVRAVCSGVVRVVDYIEVNLDHVEGFSLPTLDISDGDQALTSAQRDFIVAACAEPMLQAYLQVALRVKVASAGGQAAKPGPTYEAPTCAPSTTKTPY